jgi:hypothetical protein
LTEIVGNAGLLVENKTQMRDGIIKLLEDSATRAKLIEAGKITRPCDLGIIPRECCARAAAGHFR